MTDDDIRALRRDLGLTQAKLAELLGVTPAVVSRWENGHAKPTNSNRKQLLLLADKTYGKT